MSGLVRKVLIPASRYAHQGALSAFIPRHTYTTTTGVSNSRRRFRKGAASDCFGERACLKGLQYVQVSTLWLSQHFRHMLCTQKEALIDHCPPLTLCRELFPLKGLWSKHIEPVLRCSPVTPVLLRQEIYRNPKIGLMC